MTCEAFDRWLDAGRPAMTDARAHATSCSRCARSLAAAIAVDVALALPAAAATSPSFTDEVMRRARAARAAVPASASLAWWVKVWTEPVAVAACVLIALVAWRGPELAALGMAAASRLTGWSNGALQLLDSVNVLRALTSPLVIVGWAPAVCWASWWLFQWSERFVARRMVPTR